MMRSETQDRPAAITLAHLPRRGLVRMCHSGCLHLTYGCVTLDFHCRQYFDALVEAVANHRCSDNGARITHGNAVLTLSSEEVGELTTLVANAAEQLRQIDAVRRLFPEQAAA